MAKTVVARSQGGAAQATDLIQEVLASYDLARPFRVIDGQWAHGGDPTPGTLIAIDRLQDEADYRAVIQQWFSAVAIGGHLVIVVPHAFLNDRLLALPTRRPLQRRLYTPGSLLGEVEEALEPNSYRVRCLADDDRGYDYASPADVDPTGSSVIILLLERIAMPQWSLVPANKVKANAPDYAFEPSRTRVETPTLRPHKRILIMKLDHLGDFIMSMSALERARTLFADAHITLVVGSWNAEMARATGLADEVIPFDVFPRNSTEEEVDVLGKHAIFQATVQDEYDLAIDLRADKDTRFLLKSVGATLRAGIGTRAEFPYLDIFLPMDFNRNEPETAKEFLFNHHSFASQGSAVRHEHRIFSAAETVERDCAIVWGPYQQLRPGDYVFEPHLEVDPEGTGLVMLDVALDAKHVVSKLVSVPEPVRIAFRVEDAGSKFEFRIWAVEGAPALDFSFYGGRLIRRGAASVLHQSEYQALLIQLIADRLDRTGLLEEVGKA